MKYPIPSAPGLQGVPISPFQVRSGYEVGGRWGEQGGSNSGILPSGTRVQGGLQRHPLRLSRTFSLQMADSGGLPQVTQVSRHDFPS